MFSCFSFRPVVLAQISAWGQRAAAILSVAWTTLRKSLVPLDGLLGYSLNRLVSQTDWCEAMLLKNTCPPARLGFCISSNNVWERAVWRLFRDSLHHILSALPLWAMMPSQAHVVKSLRPLWWIHRVSDSIPIKYQQKDSDRPAWQPRWVSS